MNYYSESKLIEEDFVKNTIFTLPTQNIKLRHFQKKKIWTTLPFIQEDMENEFYIYRGYMYIYEYIYNYSNCTLSTLSDDSEAARRAAPMLDPSFGTLRMTC